MCIRDSLGHLERRNVANCLCSSFAFPNRICQLTTNSIYVEIYPVPVAVVQVGIAGTLIGGDGVWFHHLGSFQQADTQFRRGSEGLFQHCKLSIAPKPLQILQHLWHLLQIPETVSYTHLDVYKRQEEAMRYLQALQLLVLIIHPAALSAAPLFAAKELDELDGKFAMPDSICIVEIVEAILKHVELEPLRIVLAETFRLTEWGYYIAYYTDRRQALEDLNGRVAASVQYLRAGDAASFADSIADCYRHVLKRAKVYMLENYNFYKAASVRIPEKY